MDQANTLRQLLSRPGPAIQPLLGGRASPYLPIAARYVLEQQASQGDHAVLLDGTSQGLAASLGLRERHDIWKSLRGHAHLQTLGHSIGSQQCVFRAHVCMQKLSNNLHKISTLRQALLRLGWTDAYWCVALPCEAALLAAQLGQGQECLWVVQPTVQSVTEVFQGIRQVFAHAAQVQHAVIVAGVKSTEEAQALYHALCTHIAPWLGQDLRYVGLIPIHSCREPLVDQQPPVLQLGQAQCEPMQPALLD